MKYLVYCIRREDGVSYIGTSNDQRIVKRMQEHANSERFKGWKWRYDVLYETENLNDCYDKEEHFIRLYDTYRNGLNESENGRGKNNCRTFTTKGFVFSEESRKKMSETRKRKIANGEIEISKTPHTQEQREKWSRDRKNKRHSSKLTDQSVREIREIYDQRPNLQGVGNIQKNGLLLSYDQAFSKTYAQQYKVTAACIRKIISRKTWNDI